MISILERARRRADEIAEIIKNRKTDEKKNRNFCYNHGILVRILNEKGGS